MHHGQRPSPKDEVDGGFEPIRYEIGDMGTRPLVQGFRRSTTGTGRDYIYTPPLAEEFKDNTSEQINV